MTKIKICNVLLLVFLFNMPHLIAQIEVPLTNDEITKLVNPDQKKWRNLFLNLGGEILEKQAINSVLRSQQIPEISSSLLYLGVGFSYRNQDFLDTFEVELGFNFTISEEEDLSFSNTYKEVQLQLRYERKFAEIKSAFFSAGLQAKYLFASLDVFPDDSTVNLDELSNSPNNIALQYQAFFLGPSFSFNWINPNNNRLLLRVMMNYDFNLYAGNWNAQYGNTVNSFSEDGLRYSIRLLIPLYF